MESVLLTVTPVVIVLACVSLLLVRRLTAPGLGSEDLQRIENFSLTSYAPMSRLLAPEDIEFIRAQPGYRPGMDQKLRSERRKIFRSYLRSLSRDFNALHRAVRTFVADSTVDQPDLASALMRTTFYFWVGIGAVHVRLLLHAWNLEPGVFSVSHLVDSTQWMQRQLNTLAMSRMNA